MRRRCRVPQRGGQLPYVAGVGPGRDSLTVVGRGGHRLLLALPRDPIRMHAALRFGEELWQTSRGRIRPLFLAADAAPALPAELHLPDPDRHLRRAYGLADGDFILVRPDLYVECVGHLAATHPLLRHLDRLYGFDCTTPSSRLAV